MANWLKDELSTEKFHWKKAILLDIIEGCPISACVTVSTILKIGDSFY